MSKQKNNYLDELKDTLSSFGNKHNVLLIMADEFRFPIHKDAGGMTKDLKNILGFQNVNSTVESEEACISSEARALFPGFVKLRENAVVLKKHTVATTACVPSRAALFTGQYGTKNKVTQTDGVFKGASESGFNWLDPEGIPTLGDWFKENNYSTHYFGKCHFAHPKKQSLKGWGFDDWETSFPEPHGTLKNNLGMYRDHGFTDLVTTFLRRKGMALDYDQEVGRIEMNEDLSDEGKKAEIEHIKKKPWFAVASFTNPHDITTWPILPSQAQNGKQELREEEGDFRNKEDKVVPLGIPVQGTMSTPPESGTWRFDMNPGGIDKSCAELPKTWKETLQDKPDCQFDYSLKLGIALAAKTGKQFIANNSPSLTGMPLALANDPQMWTEAYMQYYAYLHHLLDQQIDRVLKTLEDTGLRENTIVVFVPDHGEYGGSHGQMMQKWHTAYQEAIHVPVVISMPPNHEKIMTDKGPKPIEELTSHIDLLPTLLGLIGVKGDEVSLLKKRLGGDTVPAFVGADLSDLITGNATKILNGLGVNSQGYRNSILFTTSDMITEPIKINMYAAPTTLEKEVDDMVSTGQENKDTDYEIYLKAVDNYIENAKGNLSVDQRLLTERMRPGSVVQPAEVHCIREDSWKLVRYRDYHDPSNQNKYQWELYNLDVDPMELYNLLEYKTEPGEARFVARPLLVQLMQRENLMTETPTSSVTANGATSMVLEELVIDEDSNEFDFTDAQQIEDKANYLYVRLLEMIESML